MEACINNESSADFFWFTYSGQTDINPRAHTNANTYVDMPTPHLVPRSEYNLRLMKVCWSLRSGQTTSVTELREC